MLNIITTAPNKYLCSDVYTGKVKVTNTSNIPVFVKISSKAPKSYSQDFIILSAKLSLDIDLENERVWLKSAIKPYTPTVELSVIT